jgi:hypothetical protein
MMPEMRPAGRKPQAKTMAPAHVGTTMRYTNRGSQRAIFLLFRCVGT